ncbi:CHAT domain-containing protein [Sphingopyxis sp. OAS728]|uniref:CHAT domain-containing protein n=1 Tax=Sphingopyxis sp. OAS728 TaxID=2663823 RepID=UPI00178C081B|nr:CHAT domain-containing protein [Sphingopyxis sp. OAS728]MBE1529521.1 CHAT domain-containing protein [Sphingopyxis sp. OAS728]
MTGLTYAPLVRAQSPQAQDDDRKAEFDKRIADIKRRQSATPYSDKSARIALLTERAGIIAEYHGEESIAHADALQLLAFEYYSEKRWREDAALRTRALAIRRKLQGDRSSDTLYAVRALAHSLAEDGRGPDAVKILADVLAAWPSGTSLTDAAEHNVPRGRTVEGKALGMAAAAHARLAIHGGDAAAALPSARIAAASSLAYRRGFGVGVLDEQMVELAERDPSTHTGEETFAEWSRLYADALWEAAGTDPSARSDALLILQDIMAGRTSRALARSAATRAAAASGAAGLAADRDAKAAEIGALFARSESMKTGSEADRALWQEIGSANAELEAIDARLTAATPGYFELVKPALLDEPSARALLADDEAFLMIVPTPRGTHSLVLTRESIEWHRSAMTETELAGHVRRLLWDVGANIEVTPEEEERWSAEGEGDFPFDRGTAFRLYEALIAPVAQALSGKRHLFTSATGSISSLPLGILVTERPAGSDGDPAILRATPWFADTAAIVQLPSLQSLQLLRTVARRGATGPGTSMIGFGDPLLEGNAATRGVEGRVRTARGGPPNASSIWRASSGEAGLADPAALRRLARLPGTEKELKAMEALVGPGKTKLFLAGAATETNVKAADLASASVLFLATHGLVAGEVGDIGEPGLVFTPPTAASPADDGYLTASEVAALHAGAGWVILSACNTAAGDGRAGAPGLSGLARAFFFAGSESLLASHWPVRDDVAAVLTVRLFEILRAHPGLSRAEALQRVEREIRGDTRDDPYLKSWSHPSAWAPFSLIGDAGR